MAHGDPISMLFETPPMFSSWYTWVFIAICGVLFAIRTYLRGPQYASRQRLTGKVAIVTGANSGIGYEVALDLARRGARIYLACRDEASGLVATQRIAKQSAGGPAAVHFLRLDLASFTSVRSFVDAYLKRETQLHILVNNAGVMLCPQALTGDGFEYHLQVNYLGHFLLVKLLRDVLVSSAPSRVVCTTAPAYSLGRLDLQSAREHDAAYGNGGGAYSQSKLAVLVFARELARRMAPFGVTCNVANPGVANTAVHRHMAFRTSSFLTLTIGPLLWFLMKSAADGAQTTVCLAVEPNLEKVTGKLYLDLQERPVRLYEESGISRDEQELAAAERLWSLSEQWVAAADGSDDDGAAEAES